jgi:hypothetical protein
VCEVIGIFGHQQVEERFQVAACSRIGILHDEKAATGVPNKDSHCPVPYSAPVDLRMNIIGDFVQSLSFGAKFQLVVMDTH